jgi:2'-5' RNA ligase
MLEPRSSKRLFFAVPLPEAARDAVAEVLRPLRVTPPGISWERRANLHLTLKFLGEVPDAQVDAVVAAAAPWVRRLPPPPLVMAGGGAFPDAHRPRVLWIGVGPPGCLTPLAQALAASLVPLGFPVEERPYTAHLTVGRVREGRADRVAAALLELGEVCRFVPESVVLYESASGPDGPRYLPVRVLPVG